MRDEGQVPHQHSNHCSCGGHCNCHLPGAGLGREFRSGRPAGECGEAAALPSGNPAGADRTQCTADSLHRHSAQRPDRLHLRGLQLVRMARVHRQWNSGDERPDYRHHACRRPACDDTQFRRFGFPDGKAYRPHFRPQGRSGLDGPSGLPCQLLHGQQYNSNHHNGSYCQGHF